MRGPGWASGFESFRSHSEVIPRKGAFLVIYVSQHQLDQVEYIIEQSIRGNHILFDVESLKSILTTGRDLSEDEAYAVEPHLEKLLSEPSLDQKRAYLDRLDSATYERVVKTYFNIVENNLFEHLQIRQFCRLDSPDYRRYRLS